MDKLKVGNFVRVKEQYACDTCRGKLLKIIHIKHGGYAYPIDCQLMVNDEGPSKQTEPFKEKALYKVNEGHTLKNIISGDMVIHG